MKKLTFVIFALFLMNIISYSQSKLGWRYEPFFFIAKNEISGMLSYKEKTSFYPQPISIYVSYKYLLSSEIIVNPRFGYLITLEESEDFFSGWEIGLLLQHKTWRQIYLSSGIIIHHNNYSVHPNMVVERDWIPFVLVGSGINISDVLNVELNYLFPLKKQYGIFNADKNRNVLGELKLSFGVEWDL